MSLKVFPFIFLLCSFMLSFIPLIIPSLHSFSFPPLIPPSVVYQEYLTQVMDESVLRGNSAIFKCAIPSFVADFVSVQAWEDLEGHSYVAADRFGRMASLSLSLSLS